MTISILLASNDHQFTQDLLTEFTAGYPEVKVYLPGTQGADNATVAACWFPPESLLTDYPNIKLLHALSAGTDHLGKALLHSGVPICRIVDPAQKQGMLEYILWGILNFQRAFDHYRHAQIQKQWQPITQRYAQETNIVLLGLGEIGGYVAQKLAQFGYPVYGWSRSQKTIEGVNCHSGEEALELLLSKADVLVNLLPLNKSTQGILSQSLFEKMPANAYVINCGRGGHMVDRDLISAVDKGRLQGALLDVFDEEPLPSDHPLWASDQITLTPHIASSSSVSTFVHQVVENAMRLESGHDLKNLLISK